MTVFLICWLAFVCMVYLIAWIDYAYYAHDLPAQFRHVRQELFEES